MKVLDRARRERKYPRDVIRELYVQAHRECTTESMDANARQFASMTVPRRFSHVAVRSSPRPALRFRSFSSTPLEKPNSGSAASPTPQLPLFGFGFNAPSKSTSTPQPESSTHEDPDIDDVTHESSPKM